MVTESINLGTKRCREEEKLPDLSSFALKRVDVIKDAMIHKRHRNLDISSLLNPSADDIEGMRRNLKLQSRPWIVYDNLQREGKSEDDHFNKSLPSDVCLPKGVIRGCSECSDCQKVTAKWDPAAACTYDLKEAPVFHPSYEELNDTAKYVDSIRKQVEPYGFCRIVPPPSWKFPCFLEEDDIWQNFRFTPQMQRVTELHNHLSHTKTPADNDIKEIKRRKLDRESSDGCAANFSSGECHEAESLKLEPCPKFTLIGFKRQADYFKQCYFSRLPEVLTTNLKQDPSEEDIEGEYWRIVEKPTENIEVLYATGNFGHGSSDPNNTELGFESLNRPASGWNLNCISSLPGSLLLFEKSDLSGSLGPQLHIGMCFSSSPWDVQEHCLYKLHYLHLGAPRIWYGISGDDAHEFEAATRKHTPKSLEKHLKLFHKPGSHLSPGTLESEGIPVYRCIQRPGDFMLFLPRAYHSGFDCGFNCSTSTVFAPLVWLPYGLASTELYRESKRKTSISYDKLLLRAANEVVKARWEHIVKGPKSSIVTTWIKASGKDGVITKALRARVSSEARCREYVSPASQSKKMDKSFDASGHKKECSFCYYDLYLSAAICSCNPNKYSCLLHAKLLCSCPWIEKLFLFRYQIDELSLLLEAVEGKITAMRYWRRENLRSPLEWDNPNQVENGLFENPSSACEASNIRAVSLEKNQDFGSNIQWEDKKPAPEELFSEDFEAKAMKFILKNSGDDRNSSSSSDWDIDACIADLESRKMELASSASSQEALPSGKSISLNHYLS
ncbi:putative lysine-specific demethylase JMJ16 [Silene latifolia]|uniref:putative lysine-specific demethylase JMJ16 n=1 Tax=Silene latifolia TaxID=37657 RepID=UPI003D7800B0